jgi:3-oxoacyl-[acyl-carrier-protein] synthase II
VEAKNHMHPLLLLNGLPVGGLFAISSTCHLQGDNGNLMSSTGASSQAVGTAFRSIRGGYADYIFAGGFDSGIEWMKLAVYGAMGLLSQNNGEPETAYRAFDRTRDGFVVGEGAGILVLEELNHALKRGANIYAEVTGYASTYDAYHPLKPSPDGNTLAIAIKKALRDAGLDPGQIDYINADGCGTPQGDKTETLAIKHVFGQNAYRTSISTIKPMMGNLLVASGGVEMAATVMAMNNNMIPPTINYHYPDDDCDLDYTPNEARAVSINAALSIDRSIDGQNVVLIIEKFLN